MEKAILLISCPDQKGINAAVTNFIFENNGNITDADQHSDEESQVFFMRVEWSLDGFHLKKEALKESFSKIASQFKMYWEVFYTQEKCKVAIFVSKHLHCYYDILYRYKSGQLPCEIAVIISNHQDAEEIAKDHDLPFYYLPVSSDNKEEQEKRQLSLLKKYGVDLIVLARYHQILSGDFVSHYQNKIINVHHSFLPAFPGQKPYHRAFEKGVKIIGATSHYVVEALDEGPIIDQKTTRVSHRDSIQDMIQKGEDLERVVFHRAIRWHLERKILCFQNKTVVFD